MDTVVIPYFAHEGEMARLERWNRRLVGVLAIAVTALVIESVMIINEHHDEEDD